MVTWTLFDLFDIIWSMPLSGLRMSRNMQKLGFKNRKNKHLSLVRLV